MELLDLLNYILSPIVLAYVGYNERSKSEMRDRVSKLIEREEASKLIDMKQKSLEVLLGEQKEDIYDTREDIRRLEEKIDKLLSK